MKVHWIHRLLILVLTAVIVLPCEEDGTFDLAFLDVRGGEVHFALAKKFKINRIVKRVPKSNPVSNLGILRFV